MKRYIKPLGLTIFGIYSSDLHKLTINTVSALIGKPLGLSNFASILDIIFAFLCLTMILLSLKNYADTRFNIKNITIWTQVTLIILFSLSIIFRFDITSIKYYSQFIGGNMVLFFGALVLCEDEKDVKYIIKFWLLTTFIMSIISIYFYLIGATYTSVRARLIPGLDIRAGYASAISIIYLVTNFKDIKSKVNKVQTTFLSIFICLLLFAVITSGSKLSFILVAIIVCAYLVCSSKKDFKSVLGLLGFLAVIGVFLAYVYVSDKGKYGMNILQLEQYIISINIRVRIFLEYLTYGLKAPLTGLGISASYNLGETHRTHSIINAMFIQIGVFGLVSYLLFISTTLYASIVNIRQKDTTKANNNIHMSLLLIFTFTIVFAEAASDIPGNRFLWLFSGLILVMQDYSLKAKTNELLYTSSLNK